MSDEIWKDIIGFENIYQISNIGRIKSLKRSYINSSEDNRTIKEKILTPSTDTNGYKVITLRKNKILYHDRIHCLVLKTFVGPRPKNYDACHMDNDKTNNDILNLRWDTHKNNCKERIRHGVQVLNRGESNGGTKLKNCQVLFIKKLLYYKIKQKKIAKLFNVSPGIICAISNKYSWTHIPDYIPFTEVK